MRRKGSRHLCWLALVESLVLDILLPGTTGEGSPDAGEGEENTLRRKRRVPTSLCFQKCPLRWRPFWLPESGGAFPISTRSSRFH